jgi:tetratricopeptide (TPR) repeat protein
MSSAAQEEGIEIRVHVTWENERPVDDVVHVQLLNNMELPIQNTFTDKEGLAVFRNLKQGDYRIKVESPKITTTVSQWVRLYQSQGMHQEWVHVSPREANGALGGKPGGVVSSAEMNIPEKARKEVDKGMESMGKNDMPAATEHFQKAVEVYPNYARAWFNLGVIKAQAKERPGAKEMWEKAIAVDSKFVPAYFSLARMSIADKQPQEAEKLLTKGLSVDPDNAEGLFLLANIQFMQGQYSQVVATAGRVHSQEHKRYADVHVIAGQSLLKQGQDQLALEQFDIYLKEYPDSPKAAQVRQAMAQIQAKLQ